MKNKNIETKKPGHPFNNQGNPAVFGTKILGFPSSGFPDVGFFLHLFGDYLLYG